MPLTPLWQLAALELCPLIALAGIVVVVGLAEEVSTPVAILPLPFLFIAFMFGAGTGWLVSGRLRVGFVVLVGRAVLLVAAWVFFWRSVSFDGCGGRNECPSIWNSYAFLVTAGIALVGPLVSSAVLVVLERRDRQAR